MCHLVYIWQIVKSHLGAKLHYILAGILQRPWPVQWAKNTRITTALIGMKIHYYNFISDFGDENRKVLFQKKKYLEKEYKHPH